MGQFDWDPRYDLGVDAMNQQHKQLLALMERLQAESETKAGKPKILGTLEELVRWTERHFKEEEKFMASFSYAELTTHALIHKNLLAKLAEHRRAFVGGSDVSLPPSFFSFLKLWLSSHILGIDMRYAEELKKKKTA